MGLSKTGGRARRARRDRGQVSDVGCQRAVDRIWNGDLGLMKGSTHKEESYCTY